MSTMSTDGVIRPANLSDAPELHALTGRSALHWGYEPAFLEWKPEAIAVTPEFLEQSTTNVLEDETSIVGYYSLVLRSPRLTLDKLFVEPTWIGHGRGKLLWLHAVNTAREMGYSEFTFDADPNAAPFYRAMGAEWLGEQETTWPGWRLQFFRFVIPAPELT